MPINKSKSDLLLEHIIKYSFDEIFITNENGKILKVSESFMNLFGINTEEVIGRNVGELEKDGIIAPSSVTSKVLKTRKIETIIQRTPIGRKIIVSGYPIYDSSFVKIS